MMSFDRVYKILITEVSEKTMTDARIFNLVLSCFNNNLSKTKEFMTTKGGYTTAEFNEILERKVNRRERIEKIRKVNKYE